MTNSRAPTSVTRPGPGLLRSNTALCDGRQRKDQFVRELRLNLGAVRPPRSGLSREFSVLGVGRRHTASWHHPPDVGVCPASPQQHRRRLPPVERREDSGLIRKIKFDSRHEHLQAASLLLTRYRHRKPEGTVPDTQSSNVDPEVPSSSQKESGHTPALRPITTVSSYDAKLPGYLNSSSEEFSRREEVRLWLMGRR